MCLVSADSFALPFGVGERSTTDLANEFANDLWAFDLCTRFTRAVDANLDSFFKADSLVVVEGDDSAREADFAEEIACGTEVAFVIEVDDRFNGFTLEDATSAAAWAGLRSSRS